jgi:hypothetical protein
VGGAQRRSVKRVPYFSTFLACNGYADPAGSFRLMFAARPIPTVKPGQRDRGDRKPAVKKSASADRARTGLRTRYTETWLESVIGYAFAVAESLIADGTICLPAGVNMRQTAKIVGQYLVRNPEFHHRSPLSSAKVALMKAFLCPKAKSQ